jgi:hypothetical protein
MRALLVYKSIYGNTRAVAEAITESLELLGGVETKSVYETADSDPDEVDLLVVGGPTNMHGLSSSPSRRFAIQVAEPQSFLVEDAEGPLAPGELERARAWGDKLAATARPSPARVCPYRLSRAGPAR